jgi:perosamine synthetase
MRYPVAAPDLTGRELDYVTDCVRSTWISSSGRYLEEFERLVAAASGKRHGIAACNGTVALHLALDALGIGPGDEVIVPTLTFVATANAVTYCGAKPVFADCTPDTWCIAPESAARLITRRTRAIIPVHLYGHPCDMEGLRTLADEHGLWIVEDAAEAIGASIAGRPVGSFGVAATYSFFGNKTISTGEGGMVVTDDDDLAQRLRLLRGQGMEPSRRYWHTLVGFNYRMTNLAAALGVAQMERAEQLIGKRRTIAGWYRERLENVPSIVQPVEQEPAVNTFWMYSVLVNRPEVRDMVMAELAQRGIETRPFFFPIHEFPMYRSHKTDRGCPRAAEISYRGLSLPTASYLTERDVDIIAGEFKAALARHHLKQLVA